jgi:hypothetical protein
LIHFDFSVIRGALDRFGPIVWRVAGDAWRGRHAKRAIGKPELESDPGLMFPFGWQAIFISAPRSSPDGFITVGKLIQYFFDCNRISAC